MIRKYIFGVFAVLLTLTLFSSAVLAQAPDIVVTNSGLALLMGETDIAPGSSVIVQIVPKGEEPLTPYGTINGYVNETIVERDGKYKLLFSLEGMYDSEKEYDCHIDIASDEYYLIPLEKGSLIEIASKTFDRDTKTITISGSLWDSSAYGMDLTLTIGSFEKTVESSEDGEFTFEFTMDEAGITTYGVRSFVIAYADDSSSYCEDSIELFNAAPILEQVRTNSRNSVELEKILTNTQNLKILGFDSGILYGDYELSDLTGSEFFKKLAKTQIKANTVSELQASIKTAYALYNMEKNPSDRNLRRCIELFELAADDEITLIYDDFNEDTEPKYLFNLWKETSFVNIADACAFYKDAVLCTKLNTAEAWSDLKVFSNGKYKLLGVSVQNSAGFWQDLIEKAPFVSVSDYKVKFNEVLNADDDPPGGGGGGGGGAGAGANKTPEPNINIMPTPPVTPPVKEPDTTTVFKDINKDHWASEPISKLHEMGIISGKSEGVFAPNDLVTRAEVAKLMCTSAKIEEVEIIEGNFGDVDSEHWAMGYIEAAFASNLINGRGDGNYGPEDCTTREDMAVFCYRLLKILKPEYSDTVYTKEDLTFADSNDIADYAVEAVAAMSKLGIINGKGDNVFDPKAYCTRAEAAKIFFGVLQ